MLEVSVESGEEMRDGITAKVESCEVIECIWMDECICDKLSAVIPQFITCDSALVLYGWSESRVMCM